MKLQLNYLAQLASNKVKCHAMGEFLQDTEYDEKPIPKTFVITGFYLDSNNEILVQLDYNGDKDEHYISDIFPILRPLSDLTKKIEIDGNRFIPVQELSRINPDPSTDPVVMNNGKINYDPYHEYCKLLEWHFDLFNLIDNGLAIDINTIK